MIEKYAECYIQIEMICSTIYHWNLYLLKRGTTLNQLKPPETIWNKLKPLETTQKLPETTWNYLKLPETSHIIAFFT